MRGLHLRMLICACGWLLGCGGGGGGGKGDNTITESTAPSGANVHAITAGGGPGNNVNLLLTSVVVCAPGTSQCLTIDNILVDTGSQGLRVPAAALASLALPRQNAPSGDPLLECVKFADTSHAWGAVATADIKIGGNTASSVRMQLIGSPAGVTEPAACGSAADNLDSIAKLGSSGILGVGYFTQDCGPACEVIANNDTYYACPPSGCVSSVAPLASQVQNPVARFGSDNNGVILQLPAVSSSGAASVDGWMIFGINTQSNNALGSAQVFTVSNVGYLDTTYLGTTYPSSFIDSGSNGLFFPNADSANLPPCAAPLDDFYCPSSRRSRNATIIGRNSASRAINFEVVNPNTFSNNVGAVNNLAGIYAAGFDWGLPFFYGRKVYTAFETNAGGAYVAF